MTKEELEKEADEFENNYTVFEVGKRADGTEYAKRVCNVTIAEAYLAGAEPREKQIADLEARFNKEKILFELIIIREQLKALTAKTNLLVAEFDGISPEPKRETIDFGELENVVRSMK